MRIDESVGWGGGGEGKGKREACMHVVKKTSSQYDDGAIRNACGFFILM